MDGSSLDHEALASRLAALQREHAELKTTVASIQFAGASDALTLQRLKRRKLQVKDEIAWLEDQLHPDIIA